MSSFSSPHSDLTQKPVVPVCQSARQNLGDTRAAKKLIEELEREPSLAPLCVVIRWMIRVREAKDEARTREAKEGFDSIRLSVTREYLKKSPEYVRHYTRQSLGLLAKNGAGAKARLWATRMC